MVRAKFYVDHITPEENYTVIELRAVTREHCAENEAFWKYTPAGSIHMSIDNPDAVSQFKEGELFYIDFTPAE